MALEVDALYAERRRILTEDRRRAAEIGDRYAAWQPGEIFMKEGRRRRAALLLKRSGVFPGPGDPCLEVGCGRLGWLVDLGPTVPSGL